MGFNVAIDGPAGAGNSTVAKAAAAELSFVYVDTGAMYRAIGLYFLTHSIDLEDEEACIAALPEIQVTICYIDGGQHIFLNEEDVTRLIRTPEVSHAASKTSAYAGVRAKLLDLQRDMAEKNDVIMDGRDIGTAILPNAELKIYLTASVGERARRRYEEMLERGEDADITEIRREIEERDYRDSHREVSPLRKAEDAVEIDSSDMSAGEVAGKIIDLVKERKNA